MATGSTPTVASPHRSPDAYSPRKRWINRRSRFEGLLTGAPSAANIALRSSATFAANTASSRRIAYAVLLIEPPSIDAGEITDKGYINQRAVLANRAALVERLYADPLAAEVVLPRA